MTQHSRSNNTNKVTRGKQYEQIAARFYEQNGYEKLEQNWRAGHKELDLIVRKSDLLVFVEVKSAHSKKYGHPATWVDMQKRSNLIAAAQQYLIDNEIDGCDLRFDVVTFEDGRLEHFPDAFPVE